MILYLAADLLWATKIKGCAESLGLACRPVRTLDMLDARLAERTAEAPVSAVLLDLEKPDEALAMIERLRGPGAAPEDRRVRIVAFGPHVLKELFQRARDAGADEVLARGALDRNMQDVLLALAGRA
jgi:CheY-like chemotaxis protein